jgi:hypothetical protein
VEENDTRFHTPGRVTLELNLDAATRHRRSDGGLVGYKGPRDSHRVAEIAAAWPHGRVEWVERPIRQVVASMLALKSDGACWATRFAPREITKHIERTGDARVRRWLLRATAADVSGSEAATLAALCWVVKRDQARAAARLLGPRLHRVEYEQLAADPTRVLRGMTDFLGLPWSRAVLDHPSVIADKPRPGLADARRSIDAGSLDRWKTGLSDDDLRAIGAVEQAFEAPGEG